jgi:hypothetical protein
MRAIYEAELIGEAAFFSEEDPIRYIAEAAKILDPLSKYYLEYQFSLDDFIHFLSIALKNAYHNYFKNRDDSEKYGDKVSAITFKLFSWEENRKTTDKWIKFVIDLAQRPFDGKSPFECGKSLASAFINEDNIRCLSPSALKTMLTEILKTGKKWDDFFYRRAFADGISEVFDKRKYDNEKKKLEAKGIDYQFILYKFLKEFN